MKIYLKIFFPLVFLLSTTAFSDVKSTSENYDAINALYSLEIIDGYGDGTFKQNNTITRAELTKIVIATRYDSAIGGASSSASSLSGGTCFTDVRTEWFAPYICTAKNKNMVNGYGDGTFRPFNEVTYAEALKISMNGLGVTVDSKNTGVWYESYFETAEKIKILNNINASSPTQKFPRGDAAQLIYNILKFQDPELEIPARSEPTLAPATQTPAPVTPTPAPATQTPAPATPTPVTKSNSRLVTTTDTLPSSLKITKNAYSWDGSFTPKSSDFPLAGLIDQTYNGTSLSPILPPGKWDWSGTEHDSANYRNFATNIGTFEALKDSDGNQYGWKLAPNKPDDVDYAGAAEYLYGSSGVDYLNLGKNGTMHSIKGNLGDGPDILVFNNSYSVDFRTGSSISGSKNDNDLVIAGACLPTQGKEVRIITTTIHTGPGNDLVFVKDMGRAAIDAGNGGSGDTSVLDSNDGNDIVVYRGNMFDFRFFGGKGSDTAVWYPDEGNQSTTWLGPNFFGGGGSGTALWGDTASTDTLVLAIPTDTPIVSSNTQKGELMIKPDNNDSIWWDEPVINDPYAKYCITCGKSSDGRYTTIMEYNSSDGRIRTGYFYINSFSRLQIGVGSNAKVYDLNQKTGTITLNTDTSKFTPPEMPTEYCS